MILPRPARSRQVQAVLSACSVMHVAPVFIARDAVLAKLCRHLVLKFGAALCNPSPWRQSGASMHLLPPFFIGAFAKRNFERDSLCQKQQKSSRLWPSLVPLQLALAPSHKSKASLAAQHLVQQQQQLQAATPIRLSQAASLAPQRERLSLSKRTFPFCRSYAAKVFNISERRFAFTGKAALSCF